MVPQCCSPLLQRGFASRTPSFCTHTPTSFANFEFVGLQQFARGSCMQRRVGWPLSGRAWQFAEAKGWGSPCGALQSQYRRQAPVATARRRPGLLLAARRCAGHCLRRGISGCRPARTFPGARPSFGGSRGTFVPSGLNCVTFVSAAPVPSRYLVIIQPAKQGYNTPGRTACI